MAEQIQKKNCFLSDVKNALIFPAIMQGAGAINTLKRSKVMGETLKEATAIKEFKQLNNVLKTTHKDIFSRSVAMADNYEQYRKAYVDAAKLVKKASKGKLSIKDNFFNLFREQEVTVDSIKSLSKEAVDNVDTLRKTVKTGEIVGKTTTSGLFGTAKSLFKKEMTSKFNFAISALTTFVPALTSKVIPAFKEKGLKEGFKELGKAAVQTASDFVAYGLGGALGRTLGSAIGFVICPGAGAFVGGAIGDAVGSMLVGGKICDKVNSVIGAKDEPTQDPELVDEASERS